MFLTKRSVKNKAVFLEMQIFFDEKLKSLFNFCILVENKEVKKVSDYKSETADYKSETAEATETQIVNYQPFTSTSKFAYQSDYKTIKLFLARYCLY